MESPSRAASRRRFLRLSGGAVALIPLVNLYGCGGEEREQQPPQTEPRPTQPEPTQPEPTQPAPAQQDAQSQAAQDGQGQSGAQEQPGDVEILDEANAQAQALGYKHDVEDVDQDAYPNYQEGQTCENCNLYQPEMGDEEWGGCQLFPGKLVNANGWCSAYVPIAQSQ